MKGSGIKYHSLEWSTGLCTQLKFVFISVKRVQTPHYLLLPVDQLTIYLMHSWAAGIFTDYLLLFWRLTSENSNLPSNLPSKNIQSHWPFGQRLIFPSWESCMFSFNWLRTQIESCRPDSWVKRSLVSYWYSCNCKEKSCCLAPWFYNLTLNSLMVTFLSLNIG